MRANRIETFAVPGKKGSAVHDHGGGEPQALRAAKNYPRAVSSMIVIMVSSTSCAVAAAPGA
jgi:hypothetical protein